MHTRRVHILLALLATAAVLCGQQYPPQQPQDPPDQPGQPVARLGVINGQASVRRGDSGEWVAAILNAPLMAGDSISVGPGGSVEMQLDYADFVRIGGDSEVRISQLDDGRNQIQVSRGLVTWRVLRESNAVSEISTPAGAVRPFRLAAVRAEVASDGSTRIIVRHGDAEVSSQRGIAPLHEGNMALLPDLQTVYAPVHDGWDTWNDQRDNYLSRSQSSQYVSQDIQGAEDLDQNGNWGYDPAYGNVWTPNVPVGWAPYRNGQWVWEDYYGWTWVDNDPWGWAPFHYGSWYFRTGFGWSWFPGQRYGRSWYHPAMVGFIGFGGGFANIGWIPLAPFEVYHPWYGRGFYGGGRLVNAGVAVNFRNARFANGVTAVSAVDFQRGAFRNQIPVSPAQLQQASLVRGGVPVAPTAANLRFSERSASAASLPRGVSSNQRFFSRMPAAPASQRTSFAQQQAAVRSSFGGAGRSQAGASGSGWGRFGEPGPGAQGNGFQAGAGSWNRFGTPQNAVPQRTVAPQAYNRPLQVAPPMVQPRAAPNYRSAPPAPRGGGGGSRPASSGGHSGGRR